MRIEIIDNFLSEEECDYLINFYNANKDIQKRYEINVNKFIKEIHITNIKEFKNLISKINNHVHMLNCEVDWINIVEWQENCNQNLHRDLASKNTVYSSISYLNQGYIGGQTFFEDGTIISPKKGRSLFFDGVYFKHGVLEVKKPPRYTLACWYKKISYE